jgi:hypothetical protein
VASRSLASAPRFRKRIVIAAALALYLLIEGLCLTALHLLALRGIQYDPRPSSLSEKQKDLLALFLSRGRGMGMDPDLGWTQEFIPTMESVLRNSETNSAGMRDDREYPPFAPAGVTRIEAFGDSFTYGADVRLDQCWARLIPIMAPQVELLNYGVPAYGLDQAYLRYLKSGAKYHPNIVFIGYMTENFERDVNVFRPFYWSGHLDWIFSKPRFTLQNGQLVLLKNPLSATEDYQRLVDNPSEVLAELGKNDFHYQMAYGKGPLDFLPSVRIAKIFWTTVKKQVLHRNFDRNGMYNAKSEAYQVTEKVFDAFYRKVLEDGALPIILILPEPRDMQRSRSHLIPRYTPLLSHLNAEHDRFVDALKAFEPYESRYRIEDVSQNWGHYTPLGNQIVADYILGQLKTFDLLDPGKVRDAIATERERLRMSNAQ